LRSPADACAIQLRQQRLSLDGAGGLQNRSLPRPAPGLQGISATRISPW
jgi:hypothetical protein